MNNLSKRILMNDLYLIGLVFARYTAIGSGIGFGLFLAMLFVGAIKWVSQ